MACFSVATIFGTPGSFGFLFLAVLGRLEAIRGILSGKLTEYVKEHKKVSVRSIWGANIPNEHFTRWALLVLHIKPEGLSLRNLVNQKSRFPSVKEVRDIA